jgi:hypothetical protein
MEKGAVQRSMHDAGFTMQKKTAPEKLQRR